MKTHPYAEVVGALLYIAAMTRPDISFAVSVLNRYVAAPTEEHWQATKRVLRYLAGTKNLGLTYQKGRGSPKTYGDSDYTVPCCTDPMLDLPSKCSSQLAICLHDVRVVACAQAHPDTRGSRSGTMVLVAGGAVRCSALFIP